MPNRPKEFRCSGINCSVTLHDGGMTLRTRRWGRSKSHELPTKRIESVIVQRKTVVPFAALTLFAAVAVVVARYNALWFLFPLDPPLNMAVSIPAFVAAVLFVVPTLSRAMFVNVVISWDGRPKSFLVRLVLASRAGRLARRFQRMSAGS